MDERKYSAWLQMQSMARQLWPVKRVNFGGSFADLAAREYPVGTQEWHNVVKGRPMPFDPPEPYGSRPLGYAPTPMSVYRQQAQAMLQRELELFRDMQRSTLGDSPTYIQARDRALHVQRELFNLERIRLDEPFYDTSPRRDRSW